MKWWACFFLSLINVLGGLALYEQTKVEATFALVGISLVLLVVSAFRVATCR